MASTPHADMVRVELETPITTTEASARRALDKVQKSLVIKIEDRYHEARRIQQAVASPGAMEEAACDLMPGATQEEKRWALRYELAGTMRAIYTDPEQPGIVRVAAAKTLMSWMGGDELVKTEMGKDSQKDKRFFLPEVVAAARKVIETVPEEETEKPS